MLVDTTSCRCHRRPAARAVAVAVFVLASASALVAAAPSADASVRAGRAGPTGRVGSGATLSQSSFTQTWSTGVLPDDGQPIALSSPVPADLDGQPAMVVGDRRGFLYAYHLADGTPVAGWPATNASGPIDSTPSILPRGRTVHGAGRIGERRGPHHRGLHGVRTRRVASSGSPRWSTRPRTPARWSVSRPGSASGRSRAAPDAVAGSLGQVSYALDATTGSHPDRVAVLQLGQHPLHRGTGRPLRHQAERDHRRRRPDRPARAGARATPTGAISGSSPRRATRSAAPTPTRSWTRHRRWVASWPAGRRASWSAPARTSAAPRTPTP